MPRIVRIYRTGGPEELRLEQAAAEQPQPGEIRLRVQAIGLNNSEAQLRRGDYPMLKADFPSRIGRECSGIVEAVAGDVAEWRPGDVVSTIPAFDVKRNGVYGEWCVVPAHAVVKVPPHLSRLEAAAVWQQYLTAYGPLVEYSRLNADSVVLVTAGASSVGLGAVQVARLFGATVIATTRSPEKANVIRRAGAQHVIVTTAEPLVERIGQITGGRGFDVAFDPVAGRELNDLAEAAAVQAKIYLYGQLSSEQAALPLLPLLRKGLTIRGYTLWEMTLDPQLRRRACDFIYSRLDSRELHPIVDRVFSLDQIVEAHRYMESGRQAGKIVIQAGETER
jgi:NADPH:quinone reductase-like Zn-dependent oxidoreductase